MTFREHLPVASSVAVSDAASPFGLCTHLDTFLQVFGPSSPSALSASVSQLLYANSHFRRFGRGEELLDPASKSLLFLCHGQALVRRRAGARIVATHTVGKGSIVGDVFGDEPRSVEALGRGTCRTVSRSFVETLLARDRTIADRLHRNAIEELNALTHFLADALTGGAQARIRTRLLSVAQSTPSPNTNTQVPLTHAQLAELAGIARPTVTSTLQRWANDGLIALSRSSITLLNLSASTG